MIRLFKAELFDKIRIKIKHLYEPYDNILALRYLYHYLPKKLLELSEYPMRIQRTKLQSKTQLNQRNNEGMEGWDKSGIGYKRKRKSETKNT